MWDTVSFLLPPFVACLVLTGIHAYLGIHVISREVIFVDIAMAQIAALGATVAFLFGYGLEGTMAYLYALGFTFLGAAVLAGTRGREGRVPQEAVIGIVYAISAAAAILVIDRAPQGAEHIKHMLVGSILTVSWAEILSTAGLYSAVGIFHWVFRRPFLLISLSPGEARARGLRIWLWDFLFYTSFGVVVTSSVRMAGVLLVFAFLVVPAVCGVLFSDRLAVRLILGWALGFLASLLGVSFSYLLDLPTGAAVVCTFGLVLIGSALVSPFVGHKACTP